jgi:FMN-dependent NADH-azoreductase
MKRALASAKAIKFERFTQTSQRAAERCTEQLINGRCVVFSSPMWSFNVDLT